MKKINLLLFLCAITLSSCHSDDVDSVIDCVVESAFFTVSKTVDVDNALNLTFNVSYTGSHTLNSVSWDFGDETAGASGTTVTHEYAASGTYEVKINPTVTEGSGGSCTSHLTKTVVVE